MKNLIVVICVLLIGVSSLKSQPSQNIRKLYDFDQWPEVMPGTNLLNWDLPPKEMSKKMLEGAHLMIDKKISESNLNRSKVWNRKFDSQEAYLSSVESNRRRFMKNIGLIEQYDSITEYGNDQKSLTNPAKMEKFFASENDAMVSETESYRIFQVRWQVLDGVYGEGLLLQPKSKPLAHIIALPDADQTPEQLSGLTKGIAPHSQFARRLVENGYQVLVPVLVNRTKVFPGQAHEQTHREWIYRQAFHMGRHLIGYEVQMVTSAIDWFKQSDYPDLKVGVAGYAEGGLIAFYSAAIDQRIDAVLVSGYFSSREEVWEEPIYRNVWSLLSEFGDAEIATLIAPRALVIEHSSLPNDLEKSTEQPADLDLYAYSGYKGSLKTPSYVSVETEYKRMDQLIEEGFQTSYLISDGAGKAEAFGTEKALEKFTQHLGKKALIPLSNQLPIERRRSFDPMERQIALLNQLEDHVQDIVRDSDKARNNFFLYNVLPEFANKEWSTKRYHPYFESGPFINQAKKYRKIFWEDVLGKFDDPYLPLNPRTKKVYDDVLWTGYEVVLDVYNDLIAPGILLIPKDILKGERRPVVVAQHGRNGVPQTLIEGNTSYYDMASKLADQGFVVYAPYGLFSGEDRYRWLDRKANTLGKTLFSFMLSQHEQTLKWLGTLPFVDKKRIAFYGKSYGGEAAMRIPAVLEGYCLSICSADFGDWTRKVADTHYENSFMHTIEWEMPYFNMGNTFSYAEMAYLIFPRPFMVERGRHDLVQPDEWVAFEYAKVSHFYDQFNLGDKTTIEYFNGGHASRNEGTFQFLHKHLNWP